MKPGQLIPIRGKWESPRAMLHHIAADEEIESFVVIAVRKDGPVGKGHYEMTRANMAYTSVICAEWSRSDDF